MLFRRKRRALVRAGALAISLATYLLSIGPATAGIVYCISPTGRSGFELVAPGQQGCSPDCGDEVEANGHEGLQAGHADCTDVALTLPQNVQRSGAGLTASAPSPLPLLRQDAAAAVPPATSVRRSQTALSPPRSAPSRLIPFTVLTI